MSAALERLALWMLGGDCHTAIGAHWASSSGSATGTEGVLHVYCHTASSTAQTQFTPNKTEQAEIELLKEQERGFYNGFFEGLKKTDFALSLYSHLRDSGFENLVSLT